ncbi:MAG: type III pantothenate kinase [Hydrogenophilus sp.]|nr:type III pantothenate kinase [Hydrogenophilus sp.]
MQWGKENRWLLLDLGNQRGKWAVVSKEDPLGPWVVAPAAFAYDSTSLQQFAQTVRPHWPFRAFGVSVVPPEIRSAVEAALPAPVTWFFPQPEACGVTCGYPNPRHLGADRWAAIIAAWRQQQRDLIVVLAGTATTLDWVDASGRHRGGAILPGIDAMGNALVAAAPNLRPFLSSPHLPSSLIATDTLSAIAAGVILAQTGAIYRFREHTSPAPPILLLAGGAAPYLLPHLSSLPVQHSPHLIFQGLLYLIHDLSS